MSPQDLGLRTIGRILRSIVDRFGSNGLSDENKYIDYIQSIGLSSESNFGPNI